MTLRELLERIGLIDPKPAGLELAARLSTSNTGHVSRRAFLGIVGTALVAANIDPEALVWTPGEKTLFLPPERAIVPATIEDVATFQRGTGRLDWIVKEVTRRLRNRLYADGAINEHYQLQVPRDQPLRIGETLLLRDPQPFVPLSDEPIHLSARPVTADHQYSMVLSARERYDLTHGSGPMVDAMLDTYAKQFAVMMKHDGVNVVGSLEIPPYISGSAHRVTAPDGVSVRGIEQYDVYDHTLQTRFDVIGAKV